MFSVHPRNQKSAHAYDYTDGLDKLLSSNEPII